MASDVMQEKPKAAVNDWPARIRPFTGVIALMVLCVIFGSQQPKFLTSSNFFNILTAVAIWGILAVGQSFPLISGGFDLSQGAIATLSGSIVAWMLSAKGLPIPVAVAGGLALGALLGALNGVLIAVVKINPFVATLGTQLVFAGTTAGLFAAQPLPLGPQSALFRQLYSGFLGPFSYPSLLFLAGVLVLTFILKWLPFGQHVYTLGGNEEATRLAGINTVRLKVQCYALSGLLAAMGALVIIAKTGQAAPTAGEGYEFKSLAICIIGGVALGGGVGSAWNVLLGALTLGVLDTGLQMAIKYPNWRDMIQGVIILLAVSIDARARLRR